MNGFCPELLLFPASVERMIVLGVALAYVVQVLLAGGDMAVGAALFRSFGVFRLGIRVHRREA